MRLRDMFHEDEIPTRPDTPNACASKCRDCGFVYGDHVAASPPAAPGPMLRAACRGLRKNFRDEEARPADATR
jgi:hypothetical protein